MTAWLGATVGASSTRSAEALPRRMRSARKAREVLSLPPSYTLRTIGIIASPEGSAAPQGRGKRAIDEGTAHPEQAGLLEPARGLHQLAVGAGDVAANVVLAKMKDGAPGPLRGGLLGARFRGGQRACGDGGCRRQGKDESADRHLP